MRDRHYTLYVDFDFLIVKDRAVNYKINIFILIKDIKKMPVANQGWGNFCLSLFSEIGFSYILLFFIYY